MKTSLVSLAADIASAALSKSAKVKARVKADQPQQLKSVTVYWRGRKMVLMQRPQRRLPALLCQMLRRSWHLISHGLIGRLGGTVRRAVGTGVMASLVLASFAAEAGVPGATLPVNSLTQTGAAGSVTNGAASISTVGNQMTIVQSTDKAILEWQSFSIGKDAGVTFKQLDANSVALNRVIGNDPSIIMGSLTANGKVFLINAAGILVGKTGRIDVAGFTASTLNMSNDDFLAGKMNFAADPGKTIGNVKNKGVITSADGGSVYLIGANVENDGIITAPNGQVLLAAGSMVKLVDTALPGVSIEVSGVDGKVTNLGQIIASAGTIGIGAALIDNSGVINASSVEKEGGRVFLRATKLLTTDATSQINADGTTGGNVQLYSDQVANIDGDVSALGSAGNGGYVDTSGKTSLSVQYVPRVGPGGTWFIDPHNVTIVTSGADTDAPVGGVITASGDDSTISASVINNALQNNTSIAISTGTTGSQTGDIVVDTGAFITETASHSATLTLSAAGGITIMGGASISDGSDSGTPGGLSLVLNAGNGITNNGGIILGGNLTVNSASFDNSSMLFLGGGTASFSSDLGNNTNGTIAGVGTINMNGHTLINNAGVVQPGYGAGTGVLTINGNYQQNAGGTLKSSVGRSAGVIIADQLKVLNGNVNLGGKLQMNALSGYTAQTGDKVSVLNYSGVRTGHFDDSTGISVVNLSVNYLLLDSGTDHNVAVGYVPSGDYYFTGGADTGPLDWGTAANWAGGVAPLSSADVYLDTGTGHSVTHSALADAIRSLTIATGALDISGGGLTVANMTEVDGALSVSGGTLNTADIYVLTGGTAQVSAGSMTVTGSTSMNGTVNVTGGTLTTQAITMAGSAGFHVSGGTANTGGITVDSGQIDVTTGGSLIASSLTIQTDGVVNVAGGSANVTGLVTDAGALIVSSGDLTMDGLGVDGSMQVSGGVVKAGSSSITGTATVNNTGSLEFTGPLSGHGSLIIGGSSHVALDNDVDPSTPLSHVTQSGGTFDVKGNFTIGNLTMSGGQINGAVGKSLTVTDSLAQTGGTIGGIGASRIDIGSFTQAAGNLVVGNINANTNLILNAANGAVSQIVGTGITSNALAVNAAQGITLNNGGNNVGAFIASNTQSGNIVLADAAALLSLNGNVTNNHGDVTITNTGNIVSTAAHDGGGNINGTDSSGTVTISSINGNLTLGRINAVNLYISAAGKIDQEATGTGGLTITNTMTTLASNGIKLDNALGTCGTNHVATFYGNNTVSGDITLTNSGSGTTHLNAITNQGGNISVNNSGALETGTDLINASGTVTIATHSPLTIGSGGVTAGSGVTLTAGDGTSGTDVLTLNGAVQATTGVVTFGGNTVFENAAVISLAPPVFPGPNPPVHGPGYSYSLPPVPITPVTPITPTNPPDSSSADGSAVNNQAANNQATNNQAANTASTTTDATTTKTSQTNLSDTTDAVSTPVTTATNSTTGTASDQTAGGSDGEFGGGDSKDEKKDSTGKSDKPVPICS